MNTVKVIYNNIIKLYNITILYFHHKDGESEAMQEENVHCENVDDDDDLLLEGKYLILIKFMLSQKPLWEWNQESINLIFSILWRERKYIKYAEHCESNI